jgi:hypothetical protein
MNSRGYFSKKSSCEWSLQYLPKSLVGTGIWVRSRPVNAPILVLADTVEHPYSQLINAHKNQILAVIIDGRPPFGRQYLLEFAPDLQETAHIGGWRYILDLAEDSGHTLGGLSLTSQIHSSDSFYRRAC